MFSERSRKLLTPANILLVNLAFSDLIIISMIPIFIYNSFLQGPAIGGFGCKAYGFLSGFSGTSTILTLAAVAVDRYLVISRPLELGKKPTRSWSYVTIGLIWFYSATFASLPFLGAGKYVPEGYLTSCSFDYLSDDTGTRVFILIFFIAAWVCPLTAIIFCYAAIIRAVYHVRQNVTRGASDLGVEKQRHRQSLSPITNSTTAIVREKKIANQLGGTHMPSRKLFDKVWRKICTVGISILCSTHLFFFLSNLWKCIQLPFFCVIYVTGINQPNVEVAIAKIVAGLVISWIIAWTPYSLIALLGISGQSHLLTPFSSMLPALFAKTAACVDPFIYSLNHPKIRQEIIYRIYNCFLQSAGRRGASFNSDIPEWKMSGSARATRQQFYHSNLHHGRIAGPLSSSRRTTRGLQVGLSSDAVRGDYSINGKDNKNNITSELSSEENRSSNIEVLESADIITDMIDCNQDWHFGRLRRLLSGTDETSCTSQNGVPTSLVHIHSTTNHHLVCATSSSMSTQL
ncbi:rhodopsin, GQ-coupled-like [Daphnia carinata]|uniref:rhodopsin, GQ-coupled-like n=1 Tax=Daphnia carinata TaxID=120202 RepID=UPI00286872E3|nr:rhodopsin, GQ-coupled-like [Daphnia carinata]